MKHVVSILTYCEKKGSIEKKEITVQLLIVWFGVQISVFWFCQSQYDSDSTFDVAAVGMSVGAEVAHHRAT